MNSDEFIRKLEEEINLAVNKRAGNTPDNFTPAAEFTQKAFEVLYGDEPWVCVNDRLYKKEGPAYIRSSDALELRRIANFCNGYAVKTKQGIRYPYAKPAKVKEVLKWAKMRLAFDPKLDNPPDIR